ncbi:MAG: serine/threonine protein kinase [Planctomycetota bacterium]|nr:MAG: serine/threonine protein kinase [Planctomycetota bacterium]
MATNESDNPTTPMPPISGQQATTPITLQGRDEAGQATHLMANQPLPRIPQVRIGQELGRGGMGVVYAGHQDWINRPVAVKVLHPSASSDEAFRARFQREAQTLARFNHPHLVTCYQAGISDAGACYLIMELIAGPDLAHWIKDQGPLNGDQVKALGMSMAEALKHAHEAGVIHRDVKCENILCAAPRDPTQPDQQPLPFIAKLADMGLARPVDNQQDLASGLTASGVSVGTPSAMAPEQFDDPASVDHRADIYALGCVLFQAWCGERAFPENSLSKIVIAKSDEPQIRKRLKDKLPDLPLSRLIGRCLHPDPSRRPADYQELLSELHRLNSSAAVVATTAYKPWMALVGLAAVALIIGLLFFRPGPSRDLSLSDPGPPVEPTLSITAQASATAEPASENLLPSGLLWQTDYANRLNDWQNVDAGWGSSEEAKPDQPYAIDGFASSEAASMQRRFAPLPEGQLLWLFSPIPDLDGRPFDSLQLQLANQEQALSLEVQALGNLALISVMMAPSADAGAVSGSFSLPGSGLDSDPYALRLSWNAQRWWIQDRSGETLWTAPVSALQPSQLSLHIRGGAVRIHRLEAINQ